MNIKVYNDNSKKYTGELQFNEYPFELSEFQKYSLDSIENNYNTLVCAPTGSGKTLVAEYIMKKYVNKSKRVIYTSPIKTLSNYLYKTFKEKYPKYSIGILTGDIKCNPDADIVIMTTEILRNLLYNKKINTSLIELTIEIDVYNDIGAIIFDEVHYISDLNRGTVWEQSLILIPQHIQLVMLSATIENPEKFCKWIQDIKNKQVVLCKTNIRAVPLNHFVYISTKKKLDNKELKIKDRENIEKFNDKLIMIFDKNKKFNDKILDELKAFKKKFRNFMSYKAILNDIALYLNNKNLLPSLFFTLSRKKCESYAKCININLNSIEEQASAKKIFDLNLRKSLNYEEIIKMEQYYILKDLIIKGVAFHHSGVYHLFKEIIEILFEKKLIKILFCTETFAVGVNMPTKTTVFTGLTKFSQSNFRYLHAHEYNQMSGRAGRRGMDKIGYSIFLPNLYNLPDNNKLLEILNGKHQIIKSKFIPDFKFVLKILLTNNNILNFVKNSLLNIEINDETKYIQKEIDGINLPNIDLSIFNEYESLINPYINKDIQYSKKVYKKRKKKALQLKKKTKFIENYEIYKKYKNKFSNKEYLISLLDSNNKYLHENIIKILKFFQKYAYIDNQLNIYEYDKILPEHINIKGVIASQISECNEILFTEILTANYLDNLTNLEIITFFSVFLNNKNIDKTLKNINISKTLKLKINRLIDLKDQFLDDMNNLSIFVNDEWILSFDMIEPIKDWVNNVNINIILKNYEIFEGNFIRNVIKLSNIMEDIIKISLLLEKIDIVEKLSNVNELLIKSIVSIESLYLK